MSAYSETHPVLIDPHASEPDKPFGIVTVDCSSPKEFDDGIAIQPLADAHETYRVHVFAVDTSPLYEQEELTRRVITQTESRYGDTKGYEPMLPEAVVLDRDFRKDTVRDALGVSFTVGVAQPPTDVSVGFTRVEVRRNFAYNRFGEKCRYSDTFIPFGRAAALLLNHLQTTNLAEEDAYHGLIHVAPSETWRRGANINQAFMVAANHLVGKVMRDEDRLAIYRVHQLEDDPYAEIFGSGIARYSTTPGPHAGLGLDVYCRVTSPLRRAEDFLMHGLLRAREEGRSPSTSDRKRVAATVLRLNQRTAASLLQEGPRLDNGHLWGRRRSFSDLAS